MIDNVYPDFFVHLLSIHRTYSTVLLFVGTQHLFHRHFQRQFHRQFHRHSFSIDIFQMLAYLDNIDDGLPLGWLNCLESAQITLTFHNWSFHCNIVSSWYKSWQLEVRLFILKMSLCYIGSCLSPRKHIAYWVLHELTKNVKLGTDFHTSLHFHILIQW